MLEALILAPLLINGNVVSQEMPYIDYLANETASFLSLDVTETNDSFIGHRFAITEPVASRTKCYITVFDKAFVESTGRTVYSERGTGLTPVTRQKFFYYADADSERITSIVTLDNDLDTLITILRSMEGDASRYGISGVSNINNAILGYIRSVNRNYSDHSEYYGIGVNSIFYGSQNNDFIEMCESDLSHGLTYNNFFGAYISQNLYSFWDHEWMDEDLIPSVPLLFDDPLGSGESIDLIHMFCSLDGCYSETGKNVPVLLSSGLFGTEKDMTSWLGDVLQACGYYANYSMSDEYFDVEDLSSFGDVLGNSSSGCSYSDFLADIDAMNIAGAFLLTNQPIHQAVSNYYQYVGESEYIRKSLFQTYASIDFTTSGQCSMSLWDKIAYYLGFEIDDDGVCYGTTSYYCDKIAFIGRDPFGAKDCWVEIRYKLGSLLFGYIVSE